jgi:hypothetical protein
MGCLLVVLTSWWQLWWCPVAMLNPTIVTWILWSTSVVTCFKWARLQFTSMLTSLIIQHFLRCSMIGQSLSMAKWRNWFWMMLLHHLQVCHLDSLLWCKPVAVHVDWLLLPGFSALLQPDSNQLALQ